MKPWLKGKGFDGHPENISKKGKGKTLSKALTELLDETVEITMEDGTRVPKSLRDVVVRKLIKKASEGDVRAIKEIFDRMEGQPRQHIQVSEVPSVIVVDAQYTDDGSNEDIPTQPEQPQEDSPQ